MPFGPAKMTFGMSAADRSYRNLTLSFRGAERQQPNALQLALRFSKLMELAESDGTHLPSMSTHERLIDVINVWHANSGLPTKHRLDDDKVRSVGNIVVGTCPVAWLKFWCCNMSH